MYLILSQALRASFALRRPTIILGGVASALFLGMVAAFGTTADTITYPGAFDQVTDFAIPQQPIRLPSRLDTYAREVRIQQGDSVANLLSRLGMQDSDALTFIRSSGNTEAIFRQLAPGKILTAQISTTGELESLIFPLNGARDSALLVNRTGNEFSAIPHDLEFDKHIVMQSAVIRHSLFGAADDAGIPENVAEQLADIFGGDIDFHRDLRKGDRFSVIYEVAYHLGKPIRSDRILAAEFINNGNTYRAFWFHDSERGGGYYTEDGRSVKKAFLRSPLEFSRITSGFSSARYHPVLQKIRAHRGIDYGAPTGTRVKATGDGVVDFIGVQGGYGKLVKIRHPGDKVTVYGHLSSFPSGLTRGKRISQGDVIGFVGATGVATGPHLHYEFQVAGIHRNPLTIALPSAAPLHMSQIRSFQTQTKGLIDQISTIRDMQLVRLD